MWQNSDPFISYILQKSRSSYKHEILLDNTIGIPILQQHGSDDDNVPAYHSRLMHELLGQTQWPSQFVELPGRGHWFEGVLTTPQLLGFYKNATDSQRRLNAPLEFAITVPSSGDIGPIYGIQVDQLQAPDLNGQIKVTTNNLESDDTWYLRTQNIHRFHLLASSRTRKPVSLVLDDQELQFIVEPENSEETWFIKNDQGQWIISHEKSWQNIYQRYGRQLGAMDAILRSDGPFTIFVCSPDTEHMALQISRSLFQYFAADTRIVKKCSSDPSVSADTFDESTGNAIIIAIGDDLPPSKNKAYPIDVRDGKLVLSRTYGHNHLEIATDEPLRKKRHMSDYAYEDGLGALFLRPLKNERLELVIWGADLHGIEQSARLIPTLTGVGQPDFLVLSQNCPCKGHAGLYAAGHFDKFWQISHNSYV